jgi:hypothetical protein
LSDQQAGLADQACPQGIHVVQGRQLEHRVAQGREGGEPAAGIGQAGNDVGLVQHDQHLEVLISAAHRQREMNSS